MSVTARSYCSGYTGLEMAVRAAFGDFEVLSHSDIKPAANVLLAHHYPHVPNLGDMRAIDYDALEAPDLMIGSWPCQPHSAAGKRLGEADPRDLWPEYLRAIDAHRPAIFFGENVARIASNGELRRVVRSLAERGYVGAWRSLRASDVGACHRRDRMFLVAVDPAAYAERRGLTEHAERHGQQVPGRDRALGLDALRRGVRGEDRLTLLKTPTAQLAVNGGSQHPDKRKAGGHGPTLADEVEWLLPTPCARDWREGAEFVPRVEKIKLTHSVKGYSLDVGRWGKFAEAIARHEQAFGRAVPRPTQPAPKSDLPQLSARFVEWMMMLPEGHVTDVPNLVDSPRKSARNAMLSLLGDGVVPAQGAAAFSFLLDHLARRFAAGVAA